MADDETLGNGVLSVVADQFLDDSNRALELALSVTLGPRALYVIVSDAACVARILRKQKEMHLPGEVKKCQAY